MNLKFAEKLSCVLIGLGGGGLPNFLHQHIPQVKKLDDQGTLVFHKFQEIDTRTLFLLLLLYRSMLSLDFIIYPNNFNLNSDDINDYYGIWL